MKLLLSVVLAVALAFGAGHCEAAALYGATASGSPGNLYVLDAATAKVVQHVGPLNDALGTNYPVTGLAFHPTTGVLYGSTGNNPSATAGLFLRIDPATALVTVVGPYNAGPTNTSGTPATMTDLSFDAAGNLYGVGSIGGPQLYSIDTLTGQATVVGNSGFTSTTGGGLAISASDEFYGTPTASRYGTYDSTSGSFSEIISPVTRPGGGGAYAALAFDSNGVLYGMNSAPGSPPPSWLATIDPATGAVTSVGRVMDDAGFVNAFDAIAFQPTIVPEPGALVLMASIATVGFARRRRMRR